MNTTTLPPSHADDHSPVDITLLSADEKRELTSADATIDASELPFTPAKSLHINAKGISTLRLPGPSSELVTSVSNADGTLAYRSTREKRNSGNCVLTDASSRALISTQYFFGPGKDPVLKRVDAGHGEDNLVRTASKWTSRTQRFVLHDGRAFEWEYKKERGFGGAGKKGTALVLSMEGKMMAALVRNADTRTPGSKKSSAGNGGELLLGGEVGGKECIAEELVVATVLLMLKKEVDRRRTVELLTLTSVVTA